MASRRVLHGPACGGRYCGSLLMRPPVLRALRVSILSPISTHQRVPCYGGRTLKTAFASSFSYQLDDLPQGLVPLAPLPQEDAEPSYPAVLLQARGNMRKFENCVLLTRVGGFYELYFEHAVEYGPLLNLKVGKKKTNAGLVPMAGFPFFQLDRYLKILVQDLKRPVAIAEEFPNDAPSRAKSRGLMHSRGVARVVTPGTLIDESFLDASTNNYILAIHSERISPDSSQESGQLTNSAHHAVLPIGLSWLDLSTGHFFMQSTTLSTLPSALARISPREIVMLERLRGFEANFLAASLEEDHHTITYLTDPCLEKIEEWTPMLEAPVPQGQLAKFSRDEVIAGSILLQYVKTRLQNLNMKLQPPFRPSEVMSIDRSTMRALEIRRTIRENVVTGSLLHTIRRTVTKGGARLLDSRITSPSTSLRVINSRLDLVDILVESESLRERLAVLLGRTHDSHRLLQKFAFGRGGPDDLLALSNTILVSQDLSTLLLQNGATETLHAIARRLDLDGLTALANRIRHTIDEEGLTQQQNIAEVKQGELQVLVAAVVESKGPEGESDILPQPVRVKKPTSIREYYDDNEAWIMRPEASPLLRRFHDRLTELNASKLTLTQDLSKRLGVKSLTLRFTPGLGHICHVKGKDMKRKLEDIISVGSSRTTRSFYHPDWSHLGKRIEQCKLSIREEEQRVFGQVRDDVIANIIKLRKNAGVLDEMDVACSFAILAVERRWVRPALNNKTAHKVVGGRHPTVEGGLEEDGRKFIRNDCFVGEPKRAWLITGPNMAGKSTFLRQNALITILGQVGSYVPAEYAEIGIVDQLFSRVGSADNLYRDQSTFMVEMLETAAILRQATPRSFVIVDEIGRGTTPKDGTAVAFGCLYHLYHINKCRTIFATHFHELADMAVNGGMDEVGFYCTDVEEEGVGFRYVHRLREGINRESHALRVAKLAGMPAEAIDIAKGILSQERDLLTD